MTTITTETAQPVNGIDVAVLHQVVRAVSDDPSQGKVGFRVKNTWDGQTRSVAEIDHFTLAGKRIARRFRVPVDEPIELLGRNTAPNPQELLMASVNACMMVGYVAGAAARGITIESLEIETSGELDLRGFLGIDAAVKPGYDSLRLVVRIKGDGTDEEFQEIHRTVLKTSPNYFNITQPVRVDASLEVTE